MGRITAKYFSNADAQLLSPIIDIAANRFNHELELDDPDKADFKIKAKQFVKIYGQVAAILPYEMLVWEQLFKIFDDVMAAQRKNELDLYRQIAKDEAFKHAMQDTIKRILEAAPPPTPEKGWKSESPRPTV